MTKGELIRFLMPFDDDIPIFVEQDMGVIAPVEDPVYRPVDKNILSINPNLGLERGEGIVIL